MYEDHTGTLITLEKPENWEIINISGINKGKQDKIRKIIFPFGHIYNYQLGKLANA